jgi:hypothetical protein
VGCGQSQKVRRALFIYVRSTLTSWRVATAAGCLTRQAQGEPEGSAKFLVFSLVGELECLSEVGWRVTQQQHKPEPAVVRAGGDSKRWRGVDKVRECRSSLSTTENVGCHRAR